MFHTEKQVINLLLVVMIMSIMGVMVAWIVETNAEERDVATLSRDGMVEINYEESVIMEIITTFNPRINVAKKKMICNEILIRAEQFGLNPFLIAGVIAAESSFRPEAVSHCKARGLMQISDTVSRMMDISNPFNVRENIYAGSRYLKMLQTEFQKEELALAAYNAGPTRVARLKRIPHIRETVNYVRKVNRYQQILKDKLIAYIQDEMTNLNRNQISWDGSMVRIKSIMYNQLSPNVTVCDLDLCETRQRLFLI